MLKMRVIITKCCLLPIYFLFLLIHRNGAVGADVLKSVCIVFLLTHATCVHFHFLSEIYVRHCLMFNCL